MYINAIDLSQKPFACVKDGCKMTFTNEDHLNVHKKKHDMTLNLGTDNSNNNVADQTPTPTRFIRNCEEVGLFQDLQNVNPFDETFRKAAELVKTGTLYIPEVSSDDSLHTPHILPHIEQASYNKFSRNNSNDPEFSVTTINDDLLKLTAKDSETSGVPENVKTYQTFLDVSAVSETKTKKITPHRIILKKKHSLASKLKLIDKKEDSGNNCNTALTLDIKIGNVNDNERKKVENCDKNDYKLKLKETLNNRINSERTDNCDVTPKQNESKESLNQNSKENTSSNSNKPVRNKNILLQTEQKIQIIYKNKLLSQKKLEKQREMNRAAQLRSRAKKKSLLYQMEEEIATLKEEKKELWLENENLQNEIIWLKTLFLCHKDCPILKDPQLMKDVNIIANAAKNQFVKKVDENIPIKKMVPILPNPVSSKPASLSLPASPINNGNATQIITLPNISLQSLTPISILTNVSAAHQVIITPQNNLTSPQMLINVASNNKSNLGNNKIIKTKKKIPINHKKLKVS